ncbi:hypothetical protein [Dysgonomonas termitidis]|uniref:Peptidase C39-like domain-containing protein n=1 Tax=Dysgonomonas termitidis TaxID=1516126 RepID=A0ABV9KS09_9BACT
MKKLTRTSLSALKRTSTVLTEQQQRAIKGGCSLDQMGVGYWIGGNYYWYRTSECTCDSGYTPGNSGYGYGGYSYWGGSGYGSSTGSGAYGSSTNPVSESHYGTLVSIGAWHGGWVMIGGQPCYMLAEVIVDGYTYTPSDYDYDPWGDSGYSSFPDDYWDILFGSGYGYSPDDSSSGWTGGGGGSSAGNSGNGNYWCDNWGGFQWYFSESIDASGHLGAGTYAPGPYNMCFFNALTYLFGGDYTTHFNNYDGYFTENGVFFSQAANYVQGEYNASVISSTQAVSYLNGNTNVMAFVTVRNNNTQHDETHAVILESYNIQDGKYTFYDPTNDRHDSEHKDEFFGLMFSIPKKN